MVIKSQEVSYNTQNTFTKVFYGKSSNNYVNYCMY